MTGRERDVSQRSRLEERARRAWAGEAANGLSLASHLYGLAHDTRDLLFDAGILASQPMPIPVISVGGLTAGGSGKTPVSAALAAWLADAGLRPTLVTGGIPDEALVHRLLNPEVPVIDRRNRRSAVREAARLGSGAAVLDSGFQHRFIRSDLQVVCVDVRSAALPTRKRLPAGPWRERWSALGRADALVLVRRVGAAGTAGEEVDDRGLLTELRRVAPSALVCHCELRPTGLRAGNTLARGATPPPTAVAVAGVMWPGPFFAALDALGIPVAERLPFGDHESYGPARLDSIRSVGEAGVVCTLKDAVKLGPLLESELPVWYLDERVEWTAGGTRLRRGVHRTVRPRRGASPIPPMQGA